MTPTPAPTFVLVAGAHGYVGRRLVKLLEGDNANVRCLVRRLSPSPESAPTTEFVLGDVLHPESLAPAFRGVGTAYYLIHSMGAGAGFEQADRQAAQNFAKAAHEAGVERIIYLGGLGNEAEALSAHLRSRHEVGAILAASGVPTFELRASIVLGAGSLSFEMIRSLVNRLPVMVTPRWVNVAAQPIAIEDLLQYLLMARKLPLDARGIYEVGGADQVSYADIMREYARQSGRSLFMLPVPWLTPHLSSLWLALVTPLYARVGRQLIESIVHPTIVRDTRAKTRFRLEPMGMGEAVRRALKDSQEGASRPAA